MSGSSDGAGGSRRARLLLAAGLLATLALLLAHVAVYWFLTDDAFISFRYARNLRQGHGLVFNPDLDRVEGYTNFLWVVLLAGCDALGLPPETAANLLSLAATLGLWGLVIRFTLRFPPPAERRWLILVPPLFLAATRSVAVWSSGGLETRLFELLALGGLLRLVVEVQAQVEHGRLERPVAAILLALATLTRPDGLVIAATGFGAAGVYLDARDRLRARVLLTWIGVYSLPVATHLLFRRLYYGDWLPNTYYAKVGGRVWWSMGWTYLGAWALEYAAYLWLPFVVAAVLHHLRRGSAFVPLLFLGVAAAQALYLAAVGGDHFEYRPLDLLFPLFFLLIYGGAQHLARRRGASLATGAALGVVLVGLLALPYQSHRQFPDHYLAGFPGDDPASSEGGPYLSPDRDPIYRLPVLRTVARAYRALLGRMSSGYVGLRQEEHRLFLASVVPEGRSLSGLVRQGRIAPETLLAISSVGAIPYYSGLPVLDRLGLTDAHVARQPFRGWVMAHSKRATLDYARARGVDFWALDEVHSLWREDDQAFYRRLGSAVRGEIVEDAPVYLAETGDGMDLLGILPRGPEQASGKFPGVRFRRTDDPEATRRVFDRGIRIFGEKVRRDPADLKARLEYALVLFDAGRYDPAIEAFTAAATAGEPQAWIGLGRAWTLKGDDAKGLAAFEGAARAQPQSVSAWYYVGETRARLGRHREAADAFTEVLRLRPYDADARLALGEAYLALGDSAAALQEYRSLLGIDSDAAAELWQDMRH
ncbi:MAG: hypothetical protein AUI47_03120 [Acidobacteria bacterium 13_1_40CM_2_68_5]|nr:MAG: hypothetical protein AUI47_03120 [Acidobacteria bacterium 13_1_40CM_2_68_5]